MLSVLLVRPSSTITFEEAGKVERAASFLQDVGFADPTYLGITPGAEGEFPTFRVIAIGGEPVNLWIRTTRNGGWEIQMVGMTDTINSADDLARLAHMAVYDWQNMPSDIRPRTDGTSGEYEGREYRHNLLAKYALDDAYWHQPRVETSGWPR
jgi:hypothetical protein